MTENLEVYFGDKGDNITVNTKDTRKKSVDVSWGSNATDDTDLEIKSSDNQTAIKTITGTTDIVSLNDGNASVLNTELGNIAVGTYMAFLIVRNVGQTRERTFKYHLIVRSR